MMKKIFALVLLLVLGKMSYSQYPIQQNLGSDSTLVISKGALQSRLINVTYTDTAAANLQRIRQYPGAQIATTTGGLNLWIRNANATAWIPVATGSGNNIYTIDGTLLGNRTLTGAGYSLTFNQLSKLLFNADSTTINTDQATILNNGVSTLSVKGATGRMFLVDTTAPADERIYELKSSNGEFFISILNDAQTSNDSAFVITSASRVGINTLNPDSTLKVGGGANILGGLRVGNLPTSPGTKQLRINAQGQFSVTDTLIDAGGTVTSVGTNNGSGITGGPITTTGTLAIDTTNVIATKASVSGGLAGKLNISDTAAMLAPYLRAVDTASLSNRINAKLNISDTATMLGNYLNNVGYGLSKVGQVASADSATLSAYYLRRKDSLTATNPLGYVTKKILSDTAAAIRSADAGGTVTSVGLTMPAAFAVAGSPITTSGTFAVTGAGLVSQYIRGDGTLANFPGGGGGGGSSVSYYLNGGTNQGTFVGNTYYEMSKTAVVGSAANFSIAADGYIAQFITDAGDPALLNIPGGNWNFEIYFNASSGGGTPSFYVELYKYDGTNFTLIASSSAAPEGITGGTAIDLYTTALAVPSTSLTLTDRLAVRVYVTHSGRTITLHTQDNTLCQIITTFTTGITALNGLTDQVQYFATGTSGTDFNISSASATHTFNLPVASGTNTGKLSNTDWTTFNNKVGGTLLNGYLTKATGTNTIDTSQLFQSSGLIGIGTTSPTQKLQVSGNAFVNGQLFAGDTALSVYQVEGILNTPYVLGRKAVDNTISTEARPTGVMGHVVGRGSIANRLQAANFYTTTDSASTANSTGSLRSVNAWTAHNGSGSLTTAWGSYNIVQNKTTGTITNAYGSVSGVENRGATSTINKLHGTTTEVWNNYGGTIDTAFGQVISIYNNNAASNIGAVYGLSIGKGLVSASGGAHYWRNSGTIGTSYGLYLDTSIDVGTTKYALFSNSNSNSYFRAKLGVGTTSPDSAFQVATGAYFQRGIRASGLPQAPGTKALRIDASGTISYADTLVDAGGTVTSVATNNGTGITGGTITTTGTLAIDTLLISTRAWRQKGVDSLQANINLKLNISDTASMLANYITGPQTFSGYMARFNGGGTIDTSRIFQNNGLIGINTTGPSYSLDVLGTGRITSNTYLATSSGVVGIGTTSADSLLTVQTGAWVKRGLRLSGLPTGTGTKSLRVDANGSLSVADTLANGISGTGTTNYIPKFTSSSAIGNSAIYDNGGNIGIGLTDAQSPLEVQSNSGGTAIRIRGRAAANSGTLRFFTNDGVTQQAKFEASDNAIEIGGLTNVPLLFYTNSSERMRLDASGNLGLGTTTFGTYGKLSVAGGISILNDNNAKLEIGRYSAGVSNSYIKLGTNSNSLRFTNNTDLADLMELTNSGNLGLGVTPSAWSSGGRIEIGNDKTIVAQGPSILLGANLYFNSGFKYVTTGASTFYYQTGGEHQWYTAPSGTAGNAISFTQAMTLDASGRLGIGTTNPGYKLDILASNSTDADIFRAGMSGVSNGFTVQRVSSSFRYSFLDGNVGIGTTSPDLSDWSAATNGLQINDDTYAALKLTGSTGKLFVASGASANFIYGYNAVDLVFGTNNSERMRITSGGNVLVGTQTAHYATTNRTVFNVNGTSSAIIGLQAANTTSGYLYVDANDFTISTEGTRNLNLITAGAAPMILQTNGTERMRITSGGNVGIGTTSPNSVLEVAGTSATTDFRISRTVSSSTYFYIKAPGGSPSTSYIGINGTDVMTLNASGNVGIGTSSPTQTLSIVSSGGPNFQLSRTGFSGYTYIEDDGTNSVYRSGGATIYQTGGTSERMRITSGGRVGIGQTAPGTALSVAGQTESWQLALTSVTGTAGAIIGSPSANVLAFGDWGGTERMRITSGGELLINTTTDAGAYYLQVNGDVYAGAYYESSDRRLKDILSVRGGSDGINTVTFKWKDQRDSLSHIGYIAQEVEKVLPDAVKTNPNGYKTINYDEVQSLKIANLEQEIAELKKVIKQLIDKK